LFTSVLTKRQRELLQAYADDVEGISKTDKDTKGSNFKEPLSVDNGEVYFNRQPQTQSLGSWLSQAWATVRERLGF
jgi:hypothetical protein